MKIHLRSLTALLFAMAALACGGTEADLDEGDDTIDAEAELFEAAYVDGKEDAARSSRFETFLGTDGKYYFHLLAGNGQKMLRSQGYTTKANATSGIASVKSNVVVDAQVELRTASDSQTYFVVKGGNGAIVALSELYATRSNAERALTTIRSGVASAASGKPSTAGARFQVFKGIDSKYYFHVRASNGQILVQSQSYTTRASAITGSRSVETNAADASRFQIRTNSDGQAFFALRAANGETIARSELYSTRSNAERARDAFSALIQSGSVAAAR